MSECSVCGSPNIFALGRCRADYRFWKRNKRDRTDAELRQLNWRRFVAQQERATIRQIVRAGRTHESHA